MACALCGAPAPETLIGYGCSTCVGSLLWDSEIVVPPGIKSPDRTSAEAWCFDRWGCAHALHRGLIIGRLTTSHIVVPCNRVSRHHAKFSRTLKGHWTIQAVHDEARIFVDGKAQSPQQAVVVLDGSTFQIADLIGFRFRQKPFNKEAPSVEVHPDISTVRPPSSFVVYGEHTSRTFVIRATEHVDDKKRAHFTVAVDGKEEKFPPRLWPLLELLLRERRRGHNLGFTTYELESRLNISSSNVSTIKGDLRTELTEKLGISKDELIHRNEFRIVERWKVK